MINLRGERRVTDRQRYHIVRSAPVGGLWMRPAKKIRFNQRMKPKSWPCAKFWFKSQLFERGNASRIARFRYLSERFK